MNNHENKESGSSLKVQDSKLMTRGKQQRKKPKNFE
jgi:hypothetical protein